MLTFDEARAIVAEKLGPTYAPEADFQVAPWGWENDTHYQLDAGPYAQLYGLSKVAPGTPGRIITVNKKTGAYTEYCIDHPSDIPLELRHTTPVGAPNPDEDDEEMDID